MYVTDAPTWLKDGRFWCARSVKGGAEIVVVDRTTGASNPCSTTRGSRHRCRRRSASYTAATLPFTTLTLSENAGAIEFGTPRWRCTISGYKCERAPSGPTAGPGRRTARRAGRGGNGGAGDSTDAVRVLRREHPTDALIQSFNVFLKSAGAPDSGMAW